MPERLLTIGDIVERLPGVSERALRAEINRLGCASKIGGQLFLDETDFQTLKQGTKVCPSSSSDADVSGTCAETRNRG